MAERIGPARCPVCASTAAHVSVAKSGWVCLTCNACNCQVFARSDNSDARLRKLLLSNAPAAPAAPAAAPEPINQPPAPPAPAPARAAPSGFLLGF